MASYPTTTSPVPALGMVTGYLDRDQKRMKALAEALKAKNGEVSPWMTQGPPLTPQPIHGSPRPPLPGVTPPAGAQAPGWSTPTAGGVDILARLREFFAKLGRPDLLERLGGVRRQASAVAAPTPNVAKAQSLLGGRQGTFQNPIFQGGGPSIDDLTPQERANRLNALGVYVGELESGDNASTTTAGTGVLTAPAPAAAQASPMNEVAHTRGPGAVAPDPAAAQAVPQAPVIAPREFPGGQSGFDSLKVDLAPLINEFNQLKHRHGREAANAAVKARQKELLNNLKEKLRAFTASLDMNGDGVPDAQQGLHLGQMKHPLHAAKFAQTVKQGRDVMKALAHQYAPVAPSSYSARPPLPTTPGPRAPERRERRGDGRPGNNGRGKKKR